jgi:hypothetical protein
MEGDSLVKEHHMRRLICLGAAVLLMATAAASAEDFTVKLLSPISTETSKEGDKITAQVISPEQFQGDFMEGVVRTSKAANKFGGKSELAFYFNVLHHGGKEYTIQGDIKSVVNSQGKQGIDDEGNVYKKQGNWKKALIGAGVGAGLGAAVGGGKGAAEGAAIGTAASLLLIEVTAKAPKIAFGAESQFVLDVKR